MRTETAPADTPIPASNAQTPAATSELVPSWWRSEGVVWGFWVAMSYEAARTAFAWVGP